MGYSAKAVFFARKIHENRSRHRKDLGIIDRGLCGVYDLEPHLQKDVHLPRHNRFYQAKIDSRYMKSGDDDFARMPNLYVITITNFDPFGYDYMMYQISNQCREVPELSYEDGLQFIYFYTKGKKGGTAASGRRNKFGCAEGVAQNCRKSPEYTGIRG